MLHFLAITQQRNNMAYRLFVAIVHFLTRNIIMCRLIPDVAHTMMRQLTSHKDVSYMSLNCYISRSIDSNVAKPPLRDKLNARGA